MTKQSLLLLLLLLVIVAGFAALVWRDVIIPRRQRRTKREVRKKDRWRAKIRTRILTDSWGLRKTRRLTDQRPIDPSGERHDQS